MHVVYFVAFLWHPVYHSIFDYVSNNLKCFINKLSKKHKKKITVMHLGTFHYCM